MAPRAEVQLHGGGSESGGRRAYHGLSAAPAPTGSRAGSTCGNPTPLDWLSLCVNALVRRPAGTALEETVAGYYDGTPELIAADDRVPSDAPELGQLSGLFVLSPAHANELLSALPGQPEASNTALDEATRTMIRGRGLRPSAALRCRLTFQFSGTERGAPWRDRREAQGGEYSVVQHHPSPHFRSSAQKGPAGGSKRGCLGDRRGLADIAEGSAPGTPIKRCDDATAPGSPRTWPRLGSG